MSTFFYEDECRALYISAGFNVTNVTCCPFGSDGYKNWSMTRANTVAVQQCPAEANIYNTHENATRSCLADGRWAKRTNYDPCIFKTQVQYGALATWIFGYTLSTITLSIALFLLRYFRTLRCLRNEIHCNLIVSFIVRVFTWYLIVIPQLITYNWPVLVMNITTMIYMFSHVANFFWMFVEGLYLFAIIVWTYGVDRFKIWHYSLIGWGIPFILASAASISIFRTIGFRRSWYSSSTTRSIKLIVIYIPILLSVIINVCVLIVIIYTLFKKMQQTKVPISRRSSKLALFSTEYKKAIKGAAVLIPLLGISHCLFIAHIDGTSEAYQIFNALLTSTQGFFVAVIYCFLNREVKFLIKAKYRSFRGYLPSASRTRHTLDDSIGQVRRGNSAFIPSKPNNGNKVFKCRAYRLSKSNNENLATPIITDKE